MIAAIEDVRVLARPLRGDAAHDSNVADSTTICPAGSERGGG